MITADVVSEDNRYHHDPKKLADTLVHLYYERHQLEQLIDKATDRDRHRLIRTGG